MGVNFINKNKICLFQKVENNHCKIVKFEVEIFELLKIEVENFEHLCLVSRNCTKYEHIHTVI